MRYQPSTTDTPRRSTSRRLTDWTEMFTDDALYVILSRENFDRNLPVGLIYCENKGMIAIAPSR